MSEQVGTATLIGVVLGGIVGFSVKQAPLCILIGLALGAAVDSWLQRRNNSDHE